MAEIRQYKTDRYDKSKESKRREGILAATLAAVALAAVGIKSQSRDGQPQTPAINAPHKVYVAKPGDSEWLIGSRAYPDIDPRKAQALIDKQNPNENHLVTPGQQFVFGTDAEIGKLVDNSSEANSASTR